MTVIWSDETHRIFETDPTTFRPTHQTFLAAIHPEDRKEVDAAFHRSTDTLVAHSLEHRVVLPDGRIKFVEERWRMFSDDLGDPVRAVGTCQDITDRKEAEEKIRRSEVLFRTLIQSSWDVFHLIEPNGRIAYESPAVTRVLGYQPEEMIGRNALEFVHPEDVASLLEGSTALVQSPGSVRTILLRIRHKDGSWRWVESFEVNLIDHLDIGGIAVNYRDITERKQAEEAQAQLTRELQQQRQRLALATESARIGIWDWDVTADVMVWDQQMYTLYGIKPDDFTGAYDAWQKGLHPQDREKAEADIAAALQGSEDFHTQFRVVWPSGEVRHIEAHGLIQRAPDGSPSRMVGVNWDISERKQLEQQVIHTEKLAALGELVAGVAHEINNPLAAISGLAQLLKMHTDQQVRDDATVINEMVLRASRIVRSLRSYARPSDMKERGVTDLNTVISSALDVVSYRLRSAEVTLTLDLAEGLPPIPMNAGEIEQVLVNLLVNAEQAVREQTIGSRTIHITTAVQPLLLGSTDTAGSGVLRIRDSGVGIPENVLPRIFDPFFTTKEMGEGTGLGLYISYGIVAAHHGTIEVESQAGAGTTFTITLPVAPET
jgi:PAS domain S-box-containing protein